MALTWEQFAQLRMERQNEWLRSIGAQPPAPEHMRPAFLDRVGTVDAQAGDWVRSWTSGGLGRWHRFSGDLAWRPAWRDVQSGTSCRRTLNLYRAEWSRERPADGVCRTCAR